eukprot:5154212-Amphidinium_carterae.1
MPAHIDDAADTIQILELRISEAQMRGKVHQIFPWPCAELPRSPSFSVHICRNCLRQVQSSPASGCIGRSHLVLPSRLRELLSGYVLWCTLLVTRGVIVCIRSVLDQITWIHENSWRFEGYKDSTAFALYRSSHNEDIVEVDGVVVSV